MTEDLTTGIITIAVVVVALALGLLLPRIEKARKAKRVVVYEHEIGLLIRDGKIERELPPGAYSTWLTNDEIVRYDGREQSLQIAGQEMLTKDLMPVRLTALIRYRTSNARLSRGAHSNPYARLYEDVQLGMRRQASSVSLDELLANRELAIAGVLEAAKESAASVGVELLSVDLRDLVLAGPAKQAYADLWKAQKDGLAALERARGEQASLRSLANAARMLKGNPELMNLRLLQALAGGPGRPAPTVVLGGAGIAPVTALTSGEVGGEGEG